MEISYKEAYQLVSEFHKKFEVPYVTPELRLRLIEEELAEFREAFAHMLKEAADLTYVIVGADVDGIKIPKELWERLDAVCDLLVPFEQIGGDVIRLVHESNMSKLGEDGKPVRREDGKVLKGPNYKEPDLMCLVPGGK